MINIEPHREIVPDVCVTIAKSRIEERRLSFREKIRGMWCE